MSAPTFIGLTGPSWGISSESSMLVQSSRASITSKKKEIPNPNAVPVACLYYDYRQELEVEGFVSGGISSAIGYTVSIANRLSANNISGGVYLDAVEIDKSNTNWQRLTLRATQYANF